MQVYQPGAVANGPRRRFAPCGVAGLPPASAPRFLVKPFAPWASACVEDARLASRKGNVGLLVSSWLRRDVTLFPLLVSKNTFNFRTTCNDNALPPQERVSNNIGPVTKLHANRNNAS